VSLRGLRIGLGKKIFFAGARLRPKLPSQKGELFAIIEHGQLSGVVQKLRIQAKREGGNVTRVEKQRPDHVRGWGTQNDAWGAFACGFE